MTWPDDLPRPQITKLALTGRQKENIFEFNWITLGQRQRKHIYIYLYIYLKQRITTSFLFILIIKLSFRWLLVMLNQHPGCAIKIPLLSNQEPTSDRCDFSFKVKAISFLLPVVSQWQVPLYGTRWQGNCSQHYNQVLLWLLPPFPCLSGFGFLSLVHWQLVAVVCCSSVPFINHFQPC